MHLYWFKSVFILFYTLESIKCGTTPYTIETLVDMILELEQKLEVSQKQLEVSVTEQISKTQQNVNQTMEKLFNKMHRVVVPEFMGKNISLLEKQKERDDQEGGCGGIVVGDECYISFEDFTPTFPRNNSKLTCVWTIRAGLHEKVFLKLTRSDFSNDKGIFLFVSPLQAYSHQRPSDSHSTSASKRLSKKKKSVLVNGPVVFLTLVAKHSSLFFPKFRVYYEGRGYTTDSSVQYRHYHFNEPQGRLDYPAIRGADTYSPNEVTTFVFNPNPPLVSIEINSLDLESKSNNCYLDALTFLSQPNSQQPSYALTRDNFESHKDWRYCQRNATFDWPKPRFSPSEVYIVVFNSDDSNEYNGFQMSWK